MDLEFTLLKYEYHLSSYRAGLLRRPDPYTDSYQALPDQAEYIGDGTWRAFEKTITGRKYADGDNCWQYVVNPTGTAYSFQDVSEAVAFLGGYKVADDWHEDMNEKMEAAQQQSNEAKAGRLTQPE